MAGDLIEKNIAFAGYTERHLTLPRSADVAVGEILAEITAQDSKIVQVVAMGNAAFADEVLPFATEYPLIYLGDAGEEAPSDAPEGGLYILALQIDDPKAVQLIEACEADGRPSGYLLETADYRLLTRATSSLTAPSFTVELEEEYSAVMDSLERHGYTLSDVHRFWNYMTNIATHYKPFNAVRDQLFATHHITRYPAATGIEAVLAKQKHVSIGFEAAQGVPVRILTSGKQCEASDYGPKFSRGVVMDFADGQNKKIHISGTSSVSNSGETILQNNVPENIAYTMQCVANLLHQEGADFSHVVAAQVYGVSNAVLKQAKTYFHDNQLAFPYIEMRTPICRDDFLFEIECIAHVSA